MSLNSYSNILNSNPAGDFFGPAFPTLSVNDWVTSSKLIDSSGHTVNVASTYCAEGSQLSSRCTAPSQAYLDQLRVVIKYQPANRYWSFQIYETLLYAAVSALLICASFWLLRRRSAS